MTACVSARPDDLCSTTDPVSGRLVECGHIEDIVSALRDGPRLMVLSGEAGIGKTTLWQYGVARCRAAGAIVLQTRPGPEDRDGAGQGLLDLFVGVEHDDAVAVDGPAVGSVFDRMRAILVRVRELAETAPVVLAVDDLPFLDDLTARTLRFVFRRLVAEPVSLLATACTWSPVTPPTPVPDLGRAPELLRVPPLTATEVRRMIRAAAPTLPIPAADRLAEHAHGNPFFALELARSVGEPGASVVQTCVSPLAALRDRVDKLPRDTRQLARLLAVAGATPLGVLGSATGVTDPEKALRVGMSSGVLALDRDFVVRFAHPLVAAAVLRDIHALDEAALHAALASVVTDPDRHAYHRARAHLDADEESAALAEESAMRLAGRGAPRTAAETLAESVRLTPGENLSARVRRTVALMVQHACAGDLPAGLGLADSLLDDLQPGPLRAEVVAARVVLDSRQAESYVRAALKGVTGADRRSRLLRGRLLGLLGWLVGLHGGRVAVGLRHTHAALETGRQVDDPVLVAQAASTLSTESLLAGDRADGLIEEARRCEASVVESQLALWPLVLHGRQQLWDGYLVQARTNFEAMDRRARDRGTEHQRSYRCCDLAQVALAAGDLAVAARYVEEGLEAAGDSGDERALSWLAYPAGLLAAWRGDEGTAEDYAQRLAWWADLVDERRRKAMAGHVRAVLAAARQDWAAGLEHTCRSQQVLDDLGIAHPGAVPVLPLAIQLASLAGAGGVMTDLARRLIEQAASVRSPWSCAHSLAARGFSALTEAQPDAFELLLEAQDMLRRLGYKLDAARVSCGVLAAAVRGGQRARALTVAEESLAFLAEQRVAGREAHGTDLLRRLRRGGEGELTETEHQVAELVSAGHRNREIAGRLFVSESTVEAHLTRIYRKLGLRNRAELTRLMLPVPT
jgi:DNA-binding CsgD family transcriptional regulator